MLQPALAHTDDMRREERDRGEARRDGQACRRQRKAADMPRAGQQPGIVADDDIDEKRGKDGEILAGVLLSEQAFIIATQLVHRDLRRTLQRAGHLLEAACGQPGKDRQHKNDRPHGRDGARHLQRADPKEDVGSFLHAITSERMRCKCLFSRRKTGLDGFIKPYYPHLSRRKTAQKFREKEQRPLSRGLCPASFGFKPV